MPLFTTLLLSLALITFVSAKFEPYASNGGLLCAIAGPDYCILATSTELTDNGVVLKTNLESSRLYKMGPGYLLTSGCEADCWGLQSQLRNRISTANFDQSNEFSSPSNLAILVSNLLYSRRSFPFYVSCIVAGLSGGCGCVWGYDSIGSHELSAIQANGEGSVLLQPILDKLFEGKERRSVPVGEHRVGNDLLPPVKTVVEDEVAEKAVEKVLSGYRSVMRKEGGNLGMKRLKLVVLRRGVVAEERIVEL